MKLPNPARAARLDQDRAAIDETIDDLLDDVNEVLADNDPNEVLIALIESFDDTHRSTVAMVAAGALLRLAAQ